MSRKRIVYFIVTLLTLIIMPCFVQSVIAGSSSAGEEQMVVRFNNPTDDIVKEFMTPKYDVAAYRPGVYLDIVVTKTKYRELALRGFDVKVTQTEDQLKRNLKKKARDALQGYRDYDMVLKELQQIESDNPGICKLYDIGDTWGKEYFDNGNTHYSNFNHEVWAMKVSDNVAVEEDEPSVYYLGVHHAREPISLEVAMAVLHNIVDNYKTDQAIAQRVNDTQIWFVPLVNPNGHKVVTSETNVWMRKNIRDNNETGRFESQYDTGYTPDGVDLNRNYGFSWGDVGSSDDRNDSSYHGTGGYSEPEVQAVKKLQGEHHFVAGITYHSFGELVIWPYGYRTGAVTPDNDAIAELGTAIAVSIPSVHPDEPVFEHGHYDPGPSWGLYPTGGGQDDDAYGDHGIFGYCIELATQFIPPAEEVDQICQDNLEAAMILLNRAYTSTLTGHITDAATGEPVVAEVFVHGIDDKVIGGADDRFPDPAEFRQPYKSDQDFGRYYRLLTNGTYDVTFTVDGYKPVTKTGIEITSEGQTVVDVALEKSDCPEIITISEDILPGMAGGSVFIPLSGTDVSVWEITYNGETAEVSKFKGIYRLQGLAEGVTTITLVAKGVGNGSPCQDEKELAITVMPAACPTNTVNTDNIDGAAINGNITIPLEGSNVGTWDITYNGHTVTLPENETSYEVTGLVGNALEVVITARGFEADGKLCVDKKTVSLNFTAPGIGNSSSAPSGPFVTGDTVTVSLETVNAVSVTLSDGVTIHNAEMVPANAPDENINNTWTFEYTTFVAGPLTATVTNPNGQTETHAWDIDVSTSDRTVSGKVTDSDTGWPLYAELTFGAATIWTDPVTGEYSIQTPDIDIPFSVRAWMNGYKEQAGEMSAGGDTTSDIALVTTPDCAPGYEVGAVLNESFDNCTLPEGWTLNDNTGTDAIWTFDTPAGYPNVTGGEGCFASCESNFWGEVDMDTELITPAIDCSGLKRVFLEFKFSYYIDSGNDIIDADISNDGGATWTNVWQKSGEQFGDQNTEIIDISEQALGKTDVRVRFHYYNANNDFLVELDDVKVYDCIAPVSGGLVVGNIFDDMTDEYSNTAFIEDEQGHRVAASATPGDLNVSDGFYSLYLPAGSHTLTVTQETYDPKVRTVDIVDFGVVKLDFEIVAFQVPKELEITDFSTEQVTLTWQVPGNTENLLGYDIYRNETKINTGLVTALTYTDTDISLWSSYSYTVAAVYDTGEGTPCSQAEVNIQGILAQAVAPDLEWTLSGQGGWVGQREEVPDEIEVAIQSDEAIGNDELCIIATTVQGPGTISFYWNVSSEADYDFFNFYIGEDTMTPAVRISGEPGWEKLTIDVPFGTQVLRWEYEKDNSVSEGLDVGWLAQVTFEANLATLLEADLNADGKTVLTWTPVDIVGVQGYIIYRDGVRLNDQVVVGTTYTDTTVVSLETYCYTVKALDGNGDETVPSGQACIMPHNRILFVDADATGANNGSSWTDAFVELQSALDFALPGDEIWVAAGIYMPDYDTAEDSHTGTREASFRLKTGVAIYGGFAGTETEVIQRNWNVNKCILSGNIGDDEDNADNSYHVIYNSDVDVTAVLNGFTVTGGNADDTQYGSGGGMYNENCSPTLTNIVFANNMASPNGSGGAMYNYNCTLTMQSIVFYSNTAYYGGAIYNDNTAITLFSATFASNEAEYGGGIDNIKSTVTAENCILWGNTGGQISDIFGSASVGYSIVQDGWEGTGNLDSDPLFVDAAAGDLRLKQGSPAIGAGKNDEDIGAAVGYDDHASQAIFVNAGATGANNGSSWADAFIELQSALDIAVSGDEIWAAAGTYTPTDKTDPDDDRTATFQLKSGVAIYGGFNGTETKRGERDWEAKATILSGDIGTTGDDTDNCFHVVTGSGTESTAVLDGFTITKAWSASAEISGGGMFSEEGSLMVANCTFSENTAYNGAGMACYGGSLTITGCTFTNNTASFDEDAWGGGMDIECDATVTDCTFKGNTAGSGAGMYFEGNSTISNCTFINNTAIYWGGGAYIYQNELELANCAFSGNTAMLGGGMVTDENAPELINCTFSGNTATAKGGGIYNWESNPTMVNSILWGNIADEDGSQVYDVPTGEEESVGGAIAETTAETTVTYSIVQDGWDGEGNQDSDPLFVNAASGDLRLKSGSPAIGTGKDGADMGAAAEYVETIMGDADGSGTIDIDDALAVAQYDIGLITSDDLNLSAADVDGNGVVNIFDALRIAEYVVGIIPDFE